MGAYINKINAQNLNCRSIATFLDKQKFEIYTLTHYSNELQTPYIENVNIFNCFFPRAFSKYFGFLWGILHCDVAYLPKGEAWRWNHFWIKWLGKKSFSTVESILDDHVLKSAERFYGSKELIIEHYRSFDRLYSITGFIRDYNKKKLGIVSEEDVLYLGVDSDFFHMKEKRVSKIKNVIMVGNDLIRKGIADYFKLAKMNPEITFHLVGSGNGRINVNSELKKEKILNVVYHGSLGHTQLRELFNIVQLHILPSRSEGFPKIVLETAAAGIPSLLYRDYGADEWLENGKNGLLVDHIFEMNEKISELSKDQKRLELLSSNAILLAKQFDWKLMIIHWERVLLEAGEDSGFHGNDNIA